MNIKREIKAMDASYDITGLTIDEFRLIKRGLMNFEVIAMYQQRQCGEWQEVKAILDKIRELDKKDTIIV